MNLILGRINIITGVRDVGKTSFCLDLIEKMKNKNILVDGLISPGKFVGNKKVGIDVRRISNGISTKLAVYSPGWDSEKPKRVWKINKEAIEWGNHAIENIKPCDVFIIDEMGFLEFEKKMGWISAFQFLEKNIFKIAFIVVRPELVESALCKWKGSKVIKLTPSDNRKEIEKSILYQIEKMSAK